MPRAPACGKSANCAYAAGAIHIYYTEKGEKVTLEEIQREIEERDRRDMTREQSPLKKAEDAILVDSSDLSIEEVAEKIISIFREKTGGN